MPYAVASGSPHSPAHHDRICRRKNESGAPFRPVAVSKPQSSVPPLRGMPQRTEPPGVFAFPVNR